MSRAYKVYLSSTLKDLRPERDGVKKALSGRPAIIKESYGASENDLITTCLEDVAESDLYIGVVGLRYGHIPGFSNPANKSITELEYERALERGVPRQIYLKSPASIASTDSDAFNKENNNGALIDQFRSRLASGKDQTAFEFSSVDDLKLMALGAFDNFAAKREGEAALLRSSLKHPAELEHEITIVCVTGTDEACRGAIAAAADKRFHLLELSPDEPHYLFKLDEGIRKSRTVCFLITAQSLNRLAPKAAMIAAALKTTAACCGSRYLLLDGVDTTALRPEWKWAWDEAIVAASPLVPGSQNVLDEVYRRVRASSNVLAPDRRIGIPCVVIALTETEADALATDPDAVLAAFPNKERAIRKLNLEGLRGAPSAVSLKWPAGFHGPAREDWRPFGPGTRTAQEILQDTVERVNSDQRPGGRERRVLRDARVHLRCYGFDEFVNDRHGSRLMLEGLRDGGCLVLVDEFALLHPALRQSAAQFLSSQRAAVVSANPCDPALCSTKEMLDDLSLLHVGSLFQRFRDDQDPRCELALNSVERLERWLRLALPELVTTLGQEESRRDLVARAPTLLSG